jgi:hypothetical protein
MLPALASCFWYTFEVQGGFPRLPGLLADAGGCGPMRSKAILAVAGLALAAFALGVCLGIRIRPSPVNKGVIAAAVQFPHSPGTPAAGNASPCVDINHAESLVGKNGCITALVLRVFSARSGNTFLDFCENYRTCSFTSVIFAADQSKFGNLQSLQGKRVEIRGEVVTYQGHAEIIIHDPRQVRSAQ